MCYTYNRKFERGLLTMKSVKIGKNYYGVDFTITHNNPFILKRGIKLNKYTTCNMGVTLKVLHISVTF